MGSRRVGPTVEGGAVEKRVRATGLAAIHLVNLLADLLIEVTVTRINSLIAVAKTLVNEKTRSKDKKLQ